MPAANASIWNKLERWSPAFLYIAGLMHALYIVQGVMQFSLSIVNFHGFNYLVQMMAMLGILGLYPVIARQKPGIVRIAAVFAELSALLYFTVFVVNLVVKLTASTALVPGIFLSASFMNAHLIISMGALLMFSFAVFRTDCYPAILGVLLLVPILLGYAETALITSISPQACVWISMIFTGMLAFVYLGMGYIIGNEDEYIQATIASLNI